ncbi:MAG TPA: HEAT repeat domain-containing protein [Phototrophicaceae bacterium]|nr:HEAT repeat domain-containing protein [Phototrophicaceae bacterium]
MRRLIFVLFVLTALAALGLSLFVPTHAMTRPLQLAALVLFMLVVSARIVTGGQSQRTRAPSSQVAEIEKLYFRAMREMINDAPNLVQAINDLQRILGIDPHYKNTRHYLSRAQAMQSAGTDATLPFVPSRNNVEFMHLQEQLIDPDPDIRKSVVMELIQYGEIATDPLIALLMDEDSDVRVHAATALGWVGGGHAVPPLLVALQDENNYVRRYAARAMCWVVNASAVEGLVESLKDEDSYVRQYAARALGWSQDARAVRPLLELLAVEQSADVRDYALTALDDLGERPARVERADEITE